MAVEKQVHNDTIDNYSQYIVNTSAKQESENQSIEN